MPLVSGITFEKTDVDRVLRHLYAEAKREPPFGGDRAKQKVIVIAGPTACGKSDLAMELAAAIKGEIVTGDSMQVYRGMDIGTAKASQADLERIPHHLVDIRNPDQPFNVVDFYNEAKDACKSILARDRVPIVVGGSGFYLHTLIYGPPPGPPPVPEIRQMLEKELSEKGLEGMLARLIQLDPEYAATLSSGDKHKIVRGLEIIAITGNKVSDMKWSAQNTPKGFNFRCWFLHRPKPILDQRIDLRCEKMISRGLLDETKRLLDAGVLSNVAATQAIGYRQSLEYLRSPQTEADYVQLMTSFKLATRHYAKRQRTWFRREPLFRWLDVETYDAETAIALIAADYEKSDE